jgi:hypothetical protein
MPATAFTVSDPVDAVLERDIDVEDETVSLERVTQIVEPAKRLPPAVWIGERCCANSTN